MRPSSPSGVPASAPPLPQELLIGGRVREVGGLAVSRVLPVRQLRQLGPFVFLDHLGPVSLPPGAGFDVPPHPHIGLCTVTYLFAGEVLHRDNLGHTQAILPGEINLMAAGRGIAHSERTPAGERAAGAALHSLQLWTALPRALEDQAPWFSHHARASLPELSGAGFRGRLLLGQAFGAASPVPAPGGPVLIDLRLEADAELRVPADLAEAGLYVVEGEVEARESGQRAVQHQLLVRAPGATLTARAVAPAHLVILGGAPLDGPRFIDWNFVASSRERIAKAKADWRARRFALIPGDEHDFVPLPEGL